KGRGRALRAAWGSSPAGVVCYMDVDLSTDLAALLPLVAPLVSGHSDVAIGTRLAHGARIERSAKRELISRAYNALLRVALRARPALPPAEPPPAARWAASPTRRASRASVPVCACRLSAGRGRSSRHC